MKYSRLWLVVGALVTVLLIALGSCSKKEASPTSNSQPPIVKRIALEDYLLVDTVRTFRFVSGSAMDLREPVLGYEQVIGEPFTDVDHDGIYDPQIDSFVRSYDPTINQDLNHNGRHEGLENTNCLNWQFPIPFDDIDGNSTIRCSGLNNYGFAAWDDTDEFVRKMPFADFNGNGVWDTLPEIGVDRGRWRMWGGRYLGFNCDSAYHFKSDKGLDYYCAGIGANLIRLNFQPKTDSLGFVFRNYQVAVPIKDSIVIPTTLLMQMYILGDTTMQIVLDSLGQLQLGDSLYTDILTVTFSLSPHPAGDVGWKFYFGKGRGVLKAVIKDFPDKQEAVLTPMDTLLPVELIRRR